jgi:hypothetical protein
MCTGFSAIPFGSKRQNCLVLEFASALQSFVQNEGYSSPCCSAQQEVYVRDVTERECMVPRYFDGGEYFRG